MRLRVLGLAVLVSLAFACDGGWVDPVGQSYTTCESDADCDRAAPECGTFRLADGATARWCTKACEYSEECRDNVDVSVGTGVCARFDENGALNYDNGTVARCMFLCEESSKYCPEEGQTCLPLLESSLLTVCASPTAP